MRHLCTLLAVTSVVAACSSSKNPLISKTEAGSSPDGGAQPANKVSGSAALTFTPTFAGFISGSGGCDVCSGPSPGPSGPSHYDETVVVLTDDPNVSAHCALDAATYLLDFKSYRYLTLSIAGIQQLTAGTYATSASTILPANATANTTAVEITESCPTDSACADSSDVFTGTVVVTKVGSSVQGTFTTTEQGDGATLELSGSFDAIHCPGISIGLPTPCLGCAVG
jgi:hypothetical protein